MSLRFFYEAENSNNLSGTDYSSGDTTGVNSNTTFSGAAAKTGAYGLVGAANTNGSILFSAGNIFPGASSPNTSVGSMSCWIKWLTGYPNGTSIAMRVYGATTNDRLAFEGSSNPNGFALRSANTINSVSVSASTNTVSHPLSSNTWYYMVGRWDYPAGKMKIEVYTDAGNNTLNLYTETEKTGLELTTTYCPSTAFTNFNVGLHSAAETDVVYTDHFMVADTYDAPLQENAFITQYAEYNETTTFTVNPFMSSQSNSAYTVGFTSSMSGTIYAVATVAGSEIPSVAQVLAGQNASGSAAKASANKSVTAVANTIVLTPTDNPKYPLYDLHVVLNSTTGNSTVHTLANEYLVAPAGKTFTVLGTLDSTSPFYGTGATVNDIAVLDSVTTPDSYAVSCVTDGTVSYIANGDVNRQIIAADVYDLSAGSYVGAGAIIFNNLAPSGKALPNLLYKKDTAITPLLLSDYGFDAEGDVVTVTAANSLPAGLGVSSSRLTGTPTAYGQTDTELVWTDTYGSNSSNTITIRVGDLVPNVTGNTQATAISRISAVASFTANVVSVSNSTVANGIAISTNPITGTLTAHDSVIDVYVSKGSGINITTTTLTPAIRNNDYSAQLAADGAVTAWSLVSGTLPPGLFLNTTTGIISGKPTTSSTYNFTVGCTNGITNDTQALSLSIAYGALGYIQIKAVPTPDGKITTKYRDGNSLNGTPAIRGAPSSLSFVEGTGGSYNFGQHGSDPDGDPVTYMVSPTYTGISINATTGVLTVATNAVAATRNMAIIITDSKGLSSSVICSVVITPQNRAPVFTNAPATLSFVEGTGGSYNFGQHGSDPDGDAITYSVSPTYTGISINSSTGILTVTAAAVAAVRNLVIKITDTGGLSANHSCAVTIAAVPPPAENDPPVFTYAPSTLSFTQGVGGSYNFGQHGSDPNGDTVTYSVTPTYTGISINSITGVLTVTSAAVAAVRSLVIRITDSKGLYSTHTCTVTIAEPQTSGLPDFIIPSNISTWDAKIAQPRRTGGTAIPNNIPGCVIELSAGTSTTTATPGTRGPLKIVDLRGTSPENKSIIRNPASGRIIFSGSQSFIIELATPINVLLDGSNGGQQYGIKSEILAGNMTLKFRGLWKNVHVRNLELDGKATVYTGTGEIGFNSNDQSLEGATGLLWRDGLLFENCYIHHFRGEGMYVGANYIKYEPGTRNIVIRNNIIEYCGRDGINGKCWWEGTNAVYGNIIRNVGLNNPDETGQLMGITIGGGTGDMYNNYLENVGEHGLLNANNDGPPTNAKFGPDLSYGPYSSFLTRIYNNVVVNAGAATWTGIVGCGIQCSGDTGTVYPEVYIFNNTCVNCRGYGIRVVKATGGWIRNNVAIGNKLGQISVASGMPVTQTSNKTTGSLTSTYRLTAEDAATGTLGVDIALTDITGVSRSGTASKGAYEYVATQTRTGIYNTVDFETGAIASSGTNPDGCYTKAMKENYTGPEDFGEGMRGLGPASNYEATNAGYSGTFDIKVGTSLTYPATPNGGSGTVNPRTGSYFLGTWIYKTKDYSMQNGSSTPNHPTLDKPRNFCSAQGTGQQWAWNEEVWIGYSIYLPPNFETDLGFSPGDVRDHRSCISVQSIFGKELQADASICNLNIFAPWNFSAAGQNTNIAKWLVSGSTGTSKYEGGDDGLPSTSSWFDLGTITDDIGRWTDFVFRLKVNPYTTATTINGITFQPNSGICQIWKSTGTSVDGNGNRTMTRVHNRYMVPFGLAMNSSTDKLMFSAPRQYKYGWKKAENNSTVVGPIFTAWDSIRFGKASLGAGFSDVHPTMMANPTP